MNVGDLVGGKYLLLRVVGEGAMGQVWAARNELTHGDVALKIITSPSPELRERMLREARACGSLKHPNIVDVYDVGQTEGGDPFLVMQLLNGETLDDRLRRVGHLAPAKAAEIACFIARALRAAHAKGIVHRDIKPANVILHCEPDADDEIVKVLDFGVSKNLASGGTTNTVEGALVGSPAYMSPEQVRGERSIDQRTDLWSLGVVLFEMLTGSRPFLAQTPYNMMTEILNAPIPSVASLVPGINPGLARVTRLCLTRDVTQRIGSAEELARILRGFTNDLVGTGDHMKPMPSIPDGLPMREGSPSSARLLASQRDVSSAHRLPTSNEIEGDSEDFIPTNVVSRADLRAFLPAVPATPPPEASNGLDAQAPGIPKIVPKRTIRMTAPLAPPSSPAAHDAVQTMPLAPAAPSPAPRSTLRLTGTPLESVRPLPPPQPAEVAQQQTTVTSVPPSASRAAGVATSTHSPLVQAPSSSTVVSIPVPRPRRGLMAVTAIGVAAIIAAGVSLSRWFNTPAASAIRVMSSAPERASPAPADSAAQPAPPTHADAEAEPAAPQAADTRLKPATPPAPPGPATATLATAAPTPAPAGSAGIRSRLGTLAIEAPPQTGVFLDGNQIGVAPLAPISARSGVHQLTFRHAVRGERVVSVTVRADMTTSISANYGQSRGRVESPGF